MRKVAKRPVVRRERFQDLDLAIEFPKGSKRPYTDDAGKEHHKTMLADYGEVWDTEGLDGDPVDVYVGPDKKSDRVFVVTQMKRGDWKKIDEEKCILGCSSAKEAKGLYLAHYNDTRFCGAIKEMSMSQFQKKLATKGTVGQKLSHNAARIAEMNYFRLQNGDPLLLGAKSGVKFATDALAPLESRHDRGLLGDDPDIEEVPGLTAFGKSQPGQKVGTSTQDRWARLKARRDPDHICRVVERLEAAFPSHKHDPVLTSHKLHFRNNENKVTLQEQAGLSIAPAARRDDPTSSALRKAAADTRVELFIKEASRHVKMADAGRAERIAGHVDDVGIGVLASPYIAEGLAKRFQNRSGVMGRIGQAAHAYHEAFPKKNRNEIAGLALVSHTVPKMIGKGIDKALPEGKKKVAAGPFAYAPRSTAPESWSQFAPARGTPQAGNTIGFSQMPSAQQGRSGVAAAQSYRAPAPSGMDASGVFSLPPSASTYPDALMPTSAPSRAPVGSEPSRAALWSGEGIPRPSPIPREFTQSEQAAAMSGPRSLEPGPMGPATAPPPAATAQTVPAPRAADTVPSATAATADTMPAPAGGRSTPAAVADTLPAPGGGRNTTPAATADTMPAPAGGRNVPAATADTIPAPAAVTHGSETIAPGGAKATVAPPSRGNRASRATVAPQPSSPQPAAAPQPAATATVAPPPRDARPTARPPARGAPVQQAPAGPAPQAPQPAQAQRGLRLNMADGGAPDIRMPKGHSVPPPPSQVPVAAGGANRALAINPAIEAQMAGKAAPVAAAGRAAASHAAVDTAAAAAKPGLLSKAAPVLKGVGRGLGGAARGLGGAARGLGRGLAAVGKGGLGLGIGALGVGALGLGAGAAVAGKMVGHGGDPQSMGTMPYQPPRMY